MQLTLIKRDHIQTYALPQKKSGQYWITHVNPKGSTENLLSIEGVNDNWYMKSNRNAAILDPDQKKLKEVILEMLSFYPVRLERQKEHAMLYVEPITEDRLQYEKWEMISERLTIGRGPQNHIEITNKYVSNDHAVIDFNKGEAFLTDIKSANGTYINGHRVKSEKTLLKPGDLIYIMGFKMIYNQGSLALNNPDGKVTVNPSILKRIIDQPTPLISDEDDEDESTMGKSFYRSPRFKRDIESPHIRIDSPPSRGNQDELPLAFLLGPSMTMGLTSLFTALFTIQNVQRTGGNISTAMPTLVMSFSMLLGTVLWPTLTKRFERKRKKEREALRVEKYRKYLKETSEIFDDIERSQKEILLENHKEAGSLVSRIKTLDRTLWERMPGQNDFLKIRLGIGNLPMQVSVQTPEKRFTMDDDQLLSDLYALIEKPKILNDVPVTFSFRDEAVVGLVGPRNLVIDNLKAWITQFITLHSYDELKLVFIFDKKEYEVLSFVKWLPHTWHSNQTMRFIANSAIDVKEINAFLEKELVKRESESDEDKLMRISPHYLIIALDKNLSNKLDVLKPLSNSKKQLGFSLLTAFEALKDLPKECSKVIELSADSSKIYDKNDVSGKQLIFAPDVFKNINLERHAVELSNIFLEEENQKVMLPSMLTFLDLFEVGKKEHLNPLMRWKENDPTLSLETPIGIDVSGNVFKLDLHEKFHGPHGLIAGMTGSGKSEFIVTFILSLALNYHPNEVAFILIDYKGGGMANTFKKLPHLAGTITNLEGAAVKRSLVSIQSELKRRQHIFNDVSQKLDVSNIDIYKYQKLFRDGIVREPLQHLFIISDEFAELKHQQPEFMEQLVSAARIGRSLGIHLILATQKPSGVVDDQIWSNSRFRICLKVQEKADSMDVIKRPDAAELSVTGRYYVQVGFNEVFSLGQSAWSGAPYYPTDRIEKKMDTQVQVIDHLGRVLKQAKLDKRKMIMQNPPKQVDEICAYLSELASEEKIKVRPLWLEPISERLLLSDVENRYPQSTTNHHLIAPVVGEADDPANQRKFALHIPFSKEGNAIVYGLAGSGKTTFLETTLFSLIKNHTPETLNVYLLDFGSETLKRFENIPHVGDVVISSEREKMLNLVKMLQKEIEKRKKMLSAYNGDILTFLHKTGSAMPNIMVMINNYAAFAELFEELEEPMSRLTRDGLKVGLNFLVTAANTSAIRYRVLQNFKQLFVLQMNDQSEYSSALGNVDGTYPAKFKGRGIYKTDMVYEFQTALVTEREFIDEMARFNNQWQGNNARKIPVLPDLLTVDFFHRELERCVDLNVPIGLDKETFQPHFYNFSKGYVHQIAWKEETHPSFLIALSELLSKNVHTELTVVDPVNLISASGKNCITDGFDVFTIELFDEIVKRHNQYKEHSDMGLNLSHKTILITSISKYFEALSTDCKEKFAALIEKPDVHCKYTFIFGDEVRALGRVNYESWYRSKVLNTQGIWIGNGIADQFVFTLNKTTNEMYKELSDAFVYKLSEGKPQLLKGIMHSEWEESSWREY